MYTKSRVQSSALYSPGMVAHICSPRTLEGRAWEKGSSRSTFATQRSPTEHTNSQTITSINLLKLKQLVWTLLNCFICSTNVHISLSFIIVIIITTFVCVYLSAHMPQHTCGSKRTTLGSQFSYPIMWVSGIKRRQTPAMAEPSCQLHMYLWPVWSIKRVYSFDNVSS